MSEVDAALAAHDSREGPSQYVDPVALASLIVGIASLAWNVYTDLRKHTDAECHPRRAEQPLEAASDGGLAGARAPFRTITGFTRSTVLPGTGAPPPGRPGWLYVAPPALTWRPPPARGALRYWLTAQVDQCWPALARRARDPGHDQYETIRLTRHRCTVGWQGTPDPAGQASPPTILRAADVAQSVTVSHGGIRLMLVRLEAV